MEHWLGIEQVPASYGPSVVTIGNFDGVHRGHRLILDRVTAAARRRGAVAVAITFAPHPAAVHRPDRPFHPITSPGQRAELLAAAGLDGLVTVAYDLTFARTAPAAFVERYLVEALGATLVVAGADLRFGRGNAGDAAVMAELSRRHGFELTIVPDQGDDDGPDRRWSSSAVRQALLLGQVERAAHILGRPHQLAGLVVHGQGRGRGLGFPTANLAAERAGLVPADGVYAGWLIDAANVRWPAAISIGTNPTFAGADRQVEAHLLGGVDLNLYGQMVRLDFAARLRGVKAFADVAALRTQVAADVERAGQLLTTAGGR